MFSVHVDEYALMKGTQFQEFSDYKLVFLAAILLKTTGNTANKKN